MRCRPVWRGWSDTGVPIAALWLSNCVIQLFLIVSFFAEYALILAVKDDQRMTLVPYVLVGAYGVRLAWTGETYAPGGRDRRVDLACAAVAMIYGAAMILADGLKFLLFRRQSFSRSDHFSSSDSARPKGAPMLRGLELALFAVIVTVALVGAWAARRRRTVDLGHGMSEEIDRSRAIQTEGTRVAAGLIAFVRPGLRALRRQLCLWSGRLLGLHYDAGLAVAERSASRSCRRCSHWRSA